MVFGGFIAKALSSKLSPNMVCILQPLYTWLQVEGFWLSVGSSAVERSDQYVLTASVRSNLKDIARVVTAR